MTDNAASHPGRLGATVLDDSTRFEVWAPNSADVEVVIERSDGELVVSLAPEPSQSEATAAASTWSAVVPGVVDGDRYRYRLDGGEALADPASRRQPDGVHGPSAVVDTNSFVWTDTEWPGVSLADTVIYELHIGTFTPDGTFDAAIEQLDRLVALGVTAVEVMPVATFPGERNWGYDGVFLFAVQESYGGPLGLARFVDAAHARNLAVLLDVVYNHFGPEGNILPRFGPYLTDDYATPWGGAVNVSGRFSDGVRRYFIENAVGWVRDFHLDGLRLDAVHAIVDPTAQPFVAELNAAVQSVGDELGREVLVTVESSSNDPRVVRSEEENGWGCDAVWDDDVHHTLRVALTGERHEYYAGYVGSSDLAAAFAHRFVYRGQHSSVFGRRHGADAADLDHAHFIVFAQNHDHVGNTPRGDRMLHAAGVSDPRLRLAAAAIILSPFTPMLFMGEEYGERAPFPYFIDHGDPDLVEAVRAGRRREFSGVDWKGGVADPADPRTYAAAVLDPTVADHEGPHRELLGYYTELLRIRREHPILRDPHADQEITERDGLIVLRRRLPDAVSSLTLNFADRPGDDDESGTVVLDSDGDTTTTIAPFGVRLRIG